MILDKLGHVLGSNHVVAFRNIPSFYGAQQSAKCSNSNSNVTIPLVVLMEIFFCNMSLKAGCRSDL